MLWDLRIRLPVRRKNCRLQLILLHGLVLRLFLYPPAMNLVHRKGPSNTPSSPLKLLEQPVSTPLKSSIKWSVAEQQVPLLFSLPNCSHRKRRRNIHPRQRENRSHNPRRSNSLPSRRRIKPPANPQRSKSKPSNPLR